MKATLFSLFVAICAIHAVYASIDSTSKFKGQVERLKLNLKFAFKSFDVYDEKKSNELDDEMDTVEKSHISNSNNYIDSVTEEIRNTVDAAKQEGKDVDSCFTTAESALKKVRMDGRTKMQKCLSESMRMAYSVFQTSNVALDAIDEQKRKIDDIFRKCAKTVNSTVEYFCLTTSLNKAEEEIRSLMKEIQAARDFILQAAEDTPFIAKSCLKNVLSDITKTATASKTEANKCVENASVAPSA